MLGGGPYECRTCPQCGEQMWNGHCKECGYEEDDSE